MPIADVDSTDVEGGANNNGGRKKKKKCHVTVKDVVAEDDAEKAGDSPTYVYMFQ